MSAHTERLERAAAEERERLASHLDRLQNQIEHAVDPKTLYARYPLPVLGVALVAGAVLGAVTKGDGRDHRPQERQPQRFRDEVKRQTAWGELRGAVVGMVAARLGDILYQVVARSLLARNESNGEDTVTHAMRRGGDERGRTRTTRA